MPCLFDVGIYSKKYKASTVLIWSNMRIVNVGLYANQLRGLKLHCGHLNWTKSTNMFKGSTCRVRIAKIQTLPAPLTSNPWFFDDRINLKHQTLRANGTLKGWGKYNLKLSNIFEVSCNLSFTQRVCWLRIHYKGTGILEVGTVVVTLRTNWGSCLTSKCII